MMDSIMATLDPNHSTSMNTLDLLGTNQETNSNLLNEGKQTNQNEGDLIQDSNEGNTILIEREPGSQIVIKIEYDNIIRRLLVPCDIPFETFKQLIERKTLRQFNRFLYFHKNMPVDIFDEDDFKLAISSAYEPHFFLSQQENNTNHSTLMNLLPTNHQDLLSTNKSTDNFNDQVDCIPRSLAAKIRQPMNTNTIKLNRQNQPTKRRTVSNSQMLTFYELRTVRRLWKEYTEGIDGRPSIRSLDEEHGPIWRRDQYQSYQRRMRIVKEIQRRAAEVGVDAAIEELERYGSLHKVTEALRERHVQSPEGRQRRERVLRGIQRRRLRLEAEAAAAAAAAAARANQQGETSNPSTESTILIDEVEDSGLSSSLQNKLSRMI